jgi:hypothetical protein
VTVVVAAGNAGADACTQSPARVPDAITVGATGGNDAFAWFSNHGACVDLSAPGVGIVSAAAASATATGTMSGTSMAAPHAAGAAALYLGANTAATPAQVGATLAARATSDVLTGVPFGTPNKLLSIAFMNDATAPAPPPAPSPAPVPLHNVTLVGQGAGRCLDADGSQGHANGSVAQLWDCFGNENQRWTLPPVGAAGEVRIWGGMCLDNDRGAWAEGDKVHVWTCLGNENQRWTLTADGQIRGKNNQCLTALDGGTANGTRLVLSACAARPEQRWTVR